MALISDESEALYKCPHCVGNIKLTTQYYVKGGQYTTVTHVDKKGLEAELNEGENKKEREDGRHTL